MVGTLVIRLILISAALVAATIVTHTFGITLTFSFLRREAPPEGSRQAAWLLIRVAWLLIVCHLIEIAIWGALYQGLGCMKDLGSAFYFSGVTYTTLGYGDLLLPARWRILGPVEALTGILTCALSASMFFAINAKIYSSLKVSSVPQQWKR